MEPSGCQTPATATISQEKNRTTAVRIAVATSESVFRIPHFARIAVIPAKKEEPTAKRIHISSAPFFIGNISRGRTVLQTIVGGYIFGVGSTIISFIILGNYSLGQQVKGTADFIGIYEQNGSLYEAIISIIRTLPCAPLVLILLLITMIAFYATSFDSIALIGACYSYHRLGENDSPHMIIQLMWCILLILLPIALVFSESSMNSLQSVSIIAAFPIGAIIVLITASFLKDAKSYLDEKK